MAVASHRCRVGDSFLGRESLYFLCPIQHDIDLRYGLRLIDHLQHHETLTVVRGFERVGDLLRNGKCVVDRDRAARDPL